MVTRRPATHFAEEVLERVLDGGLYVDAFSHVVAFARSRTETLLATVYCPIQYRRVA